MDGFVVVLVGALYVLLCIWAGVRLKRHGRGRRNQVLTGLAVYLVLTIALLFVLFPHGVAHLGTKRIWGNIAQIVVSIALLMGSAKLLGQRIQNKKQQLVIGLLAGLVWGLLFVVVNYLLK